MLKKVLLGGALLAQAALPAIAQRNCGTPDPHTLPAAEQAMLQQIERQTQNFIAQRVAMGNVSNRTATTLYTIPVVVHVVYNTAAQNISDAQIQSQIDVLNKDFSRTNTDAGNTPAAFAGVAADFQIQFQLATVAPNGSATNGIVRKSTTKTYFEYGGADANGVFVKQSSQGGDDAWNTSQYLNMWVCNFGGASSSLLGYATFPSDAGTYKDGLVMGYNYFGVTTAGGVYGYGRTTTHEIGHYFNLRHIWGDASCGNDLVSDTPTQQTSNFSCPSYPHVTCSNGPNGDMFMNYMDYVDDQCMNMFSNGQKSRAHALFQTGGARVSLLTSPGLGTPSGCGVASGLSSSSITTTSATVSWSAVSGATSYNLQYKPTAGATWTTVSTAGTSYALSGLTAGTAYQFQVQSVCASGSSAYSAAASFTTTSVGGVTYCVSKGNTITDEWIDLVQLGSINRASGADGGYYDGTGLSTSVAQGSSQTITYSTGYSGTAYTEVWNVWIDFNNNGVFTDAGEQVVTSRSNATAANLTSTFTIPATATVGNTRMRVSMKYNATATSCETFSYGEVEDYTLSITAGTGTTCGTPSGLTVGSITSSGATASWTAVSGATSYNVQYKTTAGATWTTASTSGTTYAITGLAASTGYQVQVQSVCAGGSSAYSTAVSFTTTSGSTTPTYCASKGTSVAYEYIDKVAIGSISRVSGADAGYYNGSALSTTVAAGTTQTITVSAGFVSSAYSEYFRIYADWNNNGVFTDAGETLVSSAGSTSAADRAFTFTVPTSALNGAHKVRVVMSDNSATTSCGSYSYGETEDYTFTVTGGLRQMVATASAIADLGVFPNPAQGAATLRLTLPEASALTVTVRDLQGRRVTELVVAEQAAGVVEQALPTLPAGLYMVSVRTAAGTLLSTRLVVTQ